MEKYRRLCHWLFTIDDLRFFLFFRVIGEIRGPSKWLLIIDELKMVNPVFIRVNSWLIWKNKANPSETNWRTGSLAFSVLRSADSVKKKKRNLKKQSQFLKGQNERKVNYNKGIREIYWIGHLVKTNPNKANSKPIRLFYRRVRRARGANRWLVN